MSDRSSNFLNSGVPIQSYDFDLEFGLSKPKVGNTLKDLKKQKPSVPFTEVDSKPNLNPQPFATYSNQPPFSKPTASYSSNFSQYNLNSQTNSSSATAYVHPSSNSSLPFPATSSWKSPSPSITTSDKKDSFANLFNDAVKSLKNQNQQSSVSSFSTSKSNHFKSNQVNKTPAAPSSVESFPSFELNKKKQTQAAGNLNSSEFSDFFSVLNVNTIPKQEVRNPTENLDPFSEFKSSHANDSFSKVNKDINNLNQMGNAFDPIQSSQKYDPSDEYFNFSNFESMSTSQSSAVKSKDPLFDFDFPSTQSQNLSPDMSSQSQNVDFFSANSTPNVNVDLFGDFNSNQSAQSDISKSNTAKSAVDNAFDPFESIFNTSNLPKVNQKSTVSDPLADMLMGQTYKQSKTETVNSNNQIRHEDVFESNDVNDEDGAWGDYVDGETVTELNDLPSPPPGLSLSMAVRKGKDLQRGGQFADAIKWLKWGESLLNSENDASLFAELFIVRAACYKEAGEMKKAVADCSQVLAVDPSNTAVLLQRATLYESMEKYSLGLDDLKELMKIDSSNRNARTLMTRLNKAMR